tara:strand:+ start:186 stop:665 length:480 start_codon:yes stop_codon:yes gene_type:complete
MKQNLLLLVAVASLVSGCAVKDRKGAELELVPVTHGFQIDLAPSENTSFNQQLDVYLTRNRALLLRKPVVITWANEPGLEFASKTLEWLLDVGADSRNITFKEDPKEADFTIQFTDYVVRSGVCNYQKLGNFDQNNLGCSLDGLLWKSKVNPEKVIERH